MVYKIMQSRFRVFLESLIIAFLILIIGVSLGLYIESNRTNKIIENYKNYEIQALDLKLQNYYYQIMDRSSCDEAITQNFIFADNLYDDGLKIDKFEQANQLTDDILIEKRKYVLLKTELWLNTLLLKEKCSNPFDTVVYMYSGDPNNNAQVSEQKIISNVLKGIKDKKGNKIILIPIAGDMNLGVVDLQKRIYNITSLPSIIINEKIVLNGFHTEDEISSYLRK